MARGQLPGAFDRNKKNPGDWDERGAPMVTLVSENQEGSVVGFLDVGLRSHANGCDE